MALIYFLIGTAIFAIVMLLRLYYMERNDIHPHMQ